MKAIILDTETADLEGLPIQIAYGEFGFKDGLVDFNKETMFEQFYSIGENKISIGAMAVHHIHDADLVGKPDYKEFTLSDDVKYIVGHNIDYDINAIEKCGVILDESVKQICTLRLAQEAWPHLENHKLATLIYYISRDPSKARVMLRDAHSASADVRLTANLLYVLAKAMNITSLEGLAAEYERISEPETCWFGKHKGVLIRELEVSYINWLFKQDNPNKLFRKVVYKYHPAFMPVVEKDGDDDLVDHYSI